MPTGALGKIDAHESTQPGYVGGEMNTSRKSFAGQLAAAVLVVATAVGLFVAVRKSPRRESKEEVVPPAAGLMSAAPRSSAAPATAGSAAVMACGAADCACLRKTALVELARGNARAESVLSSIAHMEKGAACFADVQGARAEALARLNRCEEARTVVSSMANAERGEAQFALAFCAYQAGMKAEARALARKAIAGERDVPGHLLLGLLALDASELETAQVELAQAVKAMPDSADAQYNLGLVYERSNDYNKARAAYLAALRAEPTYYDARYRLALLTAQAGATLESRHHVEKLRAALSADDQRVRSAEARLRKAEASDQKAMTLPGAQ